MANVDKIVVDDKTYTPDSWKALPLAERVGYLKTAKFFAGGSEVPGREAIAQLR